MVTVAFHPAFERVFSKIKDAALKERILGQFEKIRDMPDIGKPMRFARKGTREVRIQPFRLSYIYENDMILFLDLYHKDEQ